MTADERLALIQIKIERAKKHIIDLKGEIDAFLGTQPYGVVINIDSKTGKMSYQVSKITPTPRIIAAISGDAIQNLRTALDHLAWHLLLVCLGTTASDFRFHFPIANTANEYKSLIDRKVQRLRRDAIEAFRKIEAYQGGNGHQFWVLNRLNNIDKHRSIIVVGSGSHGTNLGALVQRMALRNMEQSGRYGPSFKAAEFPKLDAFFGLADDVRPLLKVGDALIENLTPDMEMDEQRDFTFDIALNEPKVIEAKSLIETVQHFADLVSNTVLLFKPCLA
jgi:hypothetical protein